MNLKKYFFHIIFIFTLLFKYSSELEQLRSNESLYYDEKYFRLLTNNYLEITQGNSWQNLYSDGIGFKSTKGFGSIELLKDWSMYNFKLTKIFFRKNCSFEYEDFECSAEMWLYHTKDNQYHPPGRRIYIKQNFFIIVIPFVNSDNDNPANDLIFDFFNLENFGNSYKNNDHKISPKKPIKLHHIIQNQPSYLFEGKYNNTDTLFMVFTQYHFMPFNMYKSLNNIETDTINTNVLKAGNLYRNVRKLEEITPKASLMVYSKGSYLKNIFAFIILLLL